MKTALIMPANSQEAMNTLGTELKRRNHEAVFGEVRFGESDFIESYNYMRTAQNMSKSQAKLHSVSKPSDIHRHPLHESGRNQRQVKLRSSPLNASMCLTLGKIEDLCHLAVWSTVASEKTTSGRRLLKK